jgi:hypothetical protein
MPSSKETILFLLLVLSLSISANLFTGLIINISPEQTKNIVQFFMGLIFMILGLIAFVLLEKKEKFI